MSSIKWFAVMALLLAVTVTSPTAAAAQAGESRLATEFDREMAKLDKDRALSRHQGHQRPNGARRHDPIWVLPDVDSAGAKVYYTLVVPPETCLDAEEESRMFGSTALLATKRRVSQSGSVETVTNDYDRRGNLIRRDDTRVEAYGFSATLTTECGYDADDRLILKTSTFASSDDPGSVRGYVYRASYNDRGQHLRETYGIDPNGDGAIDWQRTMIYVYDERHRLILKQNDWDTNLDGTTDKIERWPVVYDELGRPIYEASEADFSADGTIDVRYSHRAAWDQRDNLLWARDDDDIDGDGLPELSIWTANTYNSRGDLMLEVFDVDESGPEDRADGLSDFHTVSRYGYDAQGHVVQRLSTAYAYAPDRSLTPILWDQALMEYEAPGHLVRFFAQSDYGADGSIESTTAVTNIWQRDRVVESTMRSGWESLVSIKRDTATYDGRGNILTLTEEWIDGEDVVFSTATTFEYR